MLLNEMTQYFIDKQKPYYMYYDERGQRRDMISKIKDKYKSKLEDLFTNFGEKPLPLGGGWIAVAVPQQNDD